jgi:quercetin dioxygenase-like cupin family protein
MQLHQATRRKPFVLRRSHIAAALGVAGLLASGGAGLAQVPGTKILGGCDVPVSQRTSETGCYLIATKALQKLPDGPVFWHIYSYPSRAAAEAARIGPASIVAEAFGTVWLFAIGDATWQAPTGQRVARVGPLPVPQAKTYSARYMEAVFPPGQGLQTAVHRHSGPEAWYVVSGGQCLRTPDGTTVMRKGESGFVAGGPMMLLTGVGPETRRALVLVLHDAQEPWMTVTTEWRPTDSCPER